MPRTIILDSFPLSVMGKLWAQSRNAGVPTSSPEALDGDVILAAQVQSLNLPVADYVVATTNVAHLVRFVTAKLWTNITPGL